MSCVFARPCTALERLCSKRSSTLTVAVIGARACRAMRDTPMRFWNVDERGLTVVGKVEVHRAYYYDRHCRNGMCPKDKDLDIEGTGLSPGVRRIMARVGTYRAFGLGQGDIGRD